MKKIRRANITFLFILLWNCSFSQTSISARASGMSGISIILLDVLSTRENPAQNSAFESFSVAINASRYFNIPELNSFVGSVLYPFNKTHGVAFHISRLGSNKFYDQDFALSYGITLSKKIKIGLQLERKGKYYQSELQTSLSAWTSTIGCSTTPLSWLLLGASVSNPGGSKWNNVQRTELPRIFRIGTRINFSKNTQLYTQFNKSSGYDASFHSGIEYSPVPLLQLRTGLSTSPIKPAFGVSIIRKNTQFDFAITSQYPLGLSPEMSIQHKFN